MIGKASTKAAEGEASDKQADLNARLYLLAGVDGAG
jgi:hypothetical protein